ncbi:hypothetical protein PR001_g968 [Phytophthora rubi]|uniref:Uncharacterized protein n=1 Tax=Phytophthora rubi TaxID=129364 RepID=A0A6A3P406_9STRA|nr:hypothetical protein PR002_g1091 [Phytophthora rubi]KAE9051932.1 hypothetical protein PR001_g968 [Phytophthora rubi]
MSTPQKEESDQQPQEMQQQEQEKSEEKEEQTQDVEMEEAGTKETEEKKEEEDDKKNEEESTEKNVKNTLEKEKDGEETEQQETEKETVDEEVATTEREEQHVKTPTKAATPVAKKTPSQAASASKSAAKRKLEEPSTSDHDKTKKARASVPVKTPTPKYNGSAKKVTKAREFSFARPTVSSARRTAAVAADHVNAKAKPTPPPTRKPLHAKHTPAKVQRASMPAPKTPTTTGADKASRPHSSYTPYTGPLPPLTVESSFAPKSAYVLDRGARTASPAKTTLAPAGRKPRPASVKKAQPQISTGKENNGVNTKGGAATNGASSSKTHRTPIKSSTGSVVSKEENRSAFKEKIKSLRSLVQQTARSSPTATEDPTA